MCTYPSLTYGAQTWATTQKQLNKIYRTQLAMESRITETKLTRQSTQLKNKRLNRNKKYKIRNKKLKYADILNVTNRADGKEGYYSLFNERMPKRNASTGTWRVRKQ